MRISLAILVFIIGWIFVIYAHPHSDLFRDHLEFLVKSRPSSTRTRYRLEVLFTGRMRPDGTVEITGDMYERGTHE